MDVFSSPYPQADDIPSRSHVSHIFLGMTLHFAQQDFAFEALSPFCFRLRFVLLVQLMILWGRVSDGVTFVTPINGF